MTVFCVPKSTPTTLILAGGEQVTQAKVDQQKPVAACGFKTWLGDSLCGQTLFNFQRVMFWNPQTVCKVNST